MLKFRSLLFLFAALSACPALAQVNIIEADPNIQFVDMGFDVANDEVGIVGFVVNPNDSDDRTATVFEFNATRDGFVGQTLIGLGANQEVSVNSISSDASRIAGSSLSSGIEGVTWLRSNPNDPTGIGFLSNTSSNSQAVGAWRDGVVGDSGGQNRSVTWDIINGIQELPGTLGALTLAEDVSSNGQIVVGFSTHEVFDGAAYFWDSSGINRLDDNIDGHTTTASNASFISPNASFIGGDISAIDSAGEFNLLATTWDATRNLVVLEDATGSFIQGSTLDVADNGVAIGTAFDDAFVPSGFIYHESFGHAINFNDWLLSQDPTLQFDFELIPEAVHFDELSNTIRFTASGEGEGSFFIESQFFAVPEPSGVCLIFALVAAAALRRKRN